MLFKKIPTQREVLFYPIVFIFAVYLLWKFREGVSQPRWSKWLSVDVPLPLEGQRPCFGICRLVIQGPFTSRRLPLKKEVLSTKYATPILLQASFPPQKNQGQKGVYIAPPHPKIENGF